MQLLLVGYLNDVFIGTLPLKYVSRVTPKDDTSAHTLNINAYILTYILTLIHFHKGASVVLLVARWTTNHNHLSSNLSVDISEGCFIFDFASLPLEIARPI